MAYDAPPVYLTGPPRWTVTCEAGHTERVRAGQRPTACPACGGRLADTPIVVETSVSSLQARHREGGRKRPSGEGALFTKGDGR